MDGKQLSTLQGAPWLSGWRCHTIKPASWNNFLILPHLSHSPTHFLSFSAVLWKGIDAQQAWRGAGHGNNTSLDLRKTSRLRRHPPFNKTLKEQECVVSAFFYSLPSYEIKANPLQNNNNNNNNNPLYHWNHISSYNFHTTKDHVTHDDHKTRQAALKHDLEVLFLWRPFWLLFF